MHSGGALLLVLWPLGLLKSTADALAVDPKDALYIPHAEHWHPLPSDISDFINVTRYGVYKPESLDVWTTSGMEVEVFPIGWVQYDPEGPRTSSEHEQWHAAMKLFVKAANEKRITLGHGSDKKLLQFEAHYYLVSDEKKLNKTRPPPPEYGPIIQSVWSDEAWANIERNDTQSYAFMELDKSLVKNFDIKVTFLRDASSDVRMMQYDDLNVIQFTWRGSALELNRHTGGRFRLGFDMSWKNADFSREFMRQVSLQSNVGTMNNKIAILSEAWWWHAGQADDAAIVAEAMGLNVTFRKKNGWDFSEWEPSWRRLEDSSSTTLAPAPARTSAPTPAPTSAPTPAPTPAPPPPPTWKDVLSAAAASG